MVNEEEMMSPENLKRPLRFRHFGTSPFCEGESQTSKLPINGSIYTTNICIRLYLAHQAEGACSEPSYIYDFIFHQIFLGPCKLPRLCTRSLNLPGFYVQNPSRIKHQVSESFVWSCY
jgi:hypothetical protein